MAKIKNHNDDVKVLEKEIIPFIKKSESLKIKTPDDMAVAAETLSNINKYADAVKKKQESLTKPLNEALKNIRAMFAPLKDSLDDAILKIRGAMTTYQTESKRIADNEAAKIAARVGEGKGKISVDTAVKKMSEIDKPKNTVTVENGQIKFKTVQKFEIIDVSLLPKEYILPDEVKIRAVMKIGTQLPGVRYFSEEIPVNSR